MDVYIATKFSNKEGFHKMAAILKAAGHRITCDWTTDDVTSVPEEERKMYLQQCAGKSLMGVSVADALVLLDVPDMAGAYAEFGMALAAGLMIVVVDGFGEGKRENIFYYVPRIKHAKDMDDVLRFVGNKKKKAEPVPSQ